MQKLRYGLPSPRFRSGKQTRSVSWRLCLWVSAALLGHSESGACGCFGGSAPGGLLQPQPPWCAHSSCPAGLEGWRAVAGGTLTARSRQGARRALVMPSFPKAPFLFWSSFQRTGERQRQRSPHPSPPPPLTSARPARAECCWVSSPVPGPMQGAR